MGRGRWSPAGQSKGQAFAQRPLGARPSLRPRRWPLAMTEEEQGTWKDAMFLPRAGNVGSTHPRDPAQELRALSPSFSPSLWDQSEPF